MKSYARAQRVGWLRSFLLWAIASSTLAVIACAPAAFAKEPTLSAIELYDGRAGAAYVQLTDVAINGKIEMRQCTSAQSLDHSAYGKLGKVFLAAGGTLTRGADGTLRYSTGSGAGVCVVPENVKFEHGAAYSLSELADQALLKGIPSGPSTESVTLPPPIKKGVTLVFVSALNTELAEYLRAARASDITIWKSFINRYPTSPHLGQAKTSLATLYVGAGEHSLAAWKKSAASGAPSYPDLRDAKAQAILALSTQPGLASAADLDRSIGIQLDTLTDKGVAEMNAWHAALAARTTGYEHLQTAKGLADRIVSIDPAYAPGASLERDVQHDVAAYETAVASATSMASAGQYDRAFTQILPYRSFASEDPRLAAVVDTAYNYHLDQGRHFEKTQDWQNATAEYQKAVGVNDTAEAEADLKTARAQLVVARDKAAAASALASSQQYEQDHNIIRAYEILYELPSAQRALVKDDMDRLSTSYVQAASLAAKNLRQIHDPIKGIADEDNIEKAYVYLQRAYEITGDDSYRDRMDVLANDLSTYLLAQAKNFLAKPAGSGTELGWAYLSKALPYKAANLDDVRDAQTSAAAAHTVRSRLSIRVLFRDQTSQRESAGFAGQIENAIIGGLEGSGIPVLVVREGETTAVEPDFQLAGDVIQHHVSSIPTVVPMESHWAAATQQVPNEDWNAANRLYEQATDNLHTAQDTLQGAEARGKGGAISSAKKAVADAQAKVETAHAKLDAIPNTKTVDVIRPYNYTKKTFAVSGSVQLQFRVGESLTDQMMTDPVTITKENSQQFVVLEDVKPEDSDGVKNIGTTPDPQEFLTALETAALQDLVDAVRKRVAMLPKRIYDEARKKEDEGDLDGAGESYLRFLNMTREDNSTEREHAKQFLMDQFLLAPTPQDTTNLQADAGAPPAQ